MPSARPREDWRVARAAPVGGTRGRPAWSGPGALWLGGSGVPAELLRLADRLLGDQDIDQGRAGERHGPLEGGLQIPRVLDEPALPSERLHHLVVASAVDQRVRLQILERVVGHGRVAWADAAVVEDDDLDRQPIAAGRLHL